MVLASKRLANGSWVEVEVEERVRQHPPDLKKILKNEHTLNRFVRIMRKNIGEEEMEMRSFEAPVALEVDGDIRDADVREFADVKRKKLEAKAEKVVDVPGALENVVVTAAESVELVVESDESASRLAADVDVIASEDKLVVVELCRREASTEFGITAPLASTDSNPSSTTASTRASYAD